MVDSVGADLRADIPALEDVVYLNTGATAPSTRTAVEDVTEYLEYHEYRAPASISQYGSSNEVLDAARTAVSTLIGASKREIALTPSTTDSINRVATAIDWSPNDVVVRLDVEHAAGVLPWERVSDRDGLTTRVFETDRGRVDLDAYADAVSDARLVCLSATDWIYGVRKPVRALTEIAHDAGALVLVDGVQAIGQYPVDVAEWGADFVSGSGHKWLLAPWGSGYLYVREAVAETMEPAHLGPLSVVDPNAADYVFRADAQRFEVSTSSISPYVGLCATVDQLTTVGIDAVDSRISALVAHLRAQLDDDYVRSPPEAASGLVSVETPHPEELVQHLANDGVRVRSIQSPPSIRISLHAFNTRSDVEALVRSLREHEHGAQLLET